jgi:hypothetical protein
MAFVLELMNQMLNLSPLFVKVHGGSRIKVYPSPEDLVYRIIPVSVKIGPGKMIKAFCANNLFIRKQIVATGRTGLWKKQRYKIINKVHGDPKLIKSRK